VKVVSLPTVVMAHLPISSVLIQTFAITGKAAFRSLQGAYENP
jgi:hypothetical protein